MSLVNQSNSQKARAKSNRLLGGVLMGFVALVFVVTIAKMFVGNQSAKSAQTPANEAAQ